MALLNTDIGPERVQVFDQPIGTVQIPGAATSTAAFLISTTLAAAPVNVPTLVNGMTQFTSLFGDANSVADDGFYAVQGFYDNAGDGAPAVIVNVGQGTAEVTSVTCVADSSGSLNSKYWTLSSAYDRNKYYVWYNVAGLGVDPAVSGRTGVMVAIATNTTASAVATATATALAALPDFLATPSGATVTVTNKAGGPATDAVDGAATTGFTFSVTTQGARPLATDYIGQASLGSGLRALDTVDVIGLLTVPGLPLATAYQVHPALIDYAKTVRAEFGAQLSTSFSLCAVPKEITKANTDVQLLSTTVSSIAGPVLTLADAVPATVTPGMVIEKAGVIKSVITAVSGSTVTVTQPSNFQTSDAVTLNIPSAINYKDTVVNDPSRVAAWYFNNVIVNDLSTAGVAGGLQRTVDPTGHVAGVMARIDANHAIGGPSHAPAGIQFAGLAGILGLNLSLSERLDAAPLRLAFINRLTSFPGSGNVVYGGYTAGGSFVTADEQLIQVMRTLQFIKGSLEPGLRGFIWENEDPRNQERVARAIQSFLRNNVYLFPAGLPESSQFKVISVTPTQDELDQGLLRVRVQVRPNKAIRFIEVTLEFPLPAA